MIIAKFYDKNGKLKLIKGKSNDKSFIRFKLFKNKKEFPCCDWKGKCPNKAYAEVFPSLLKKNSKKGWSYLCKKHYLLEQKRLNNNLPACLDVQW